MGEVNRPMVVDIKNDDMDVLEAIALAGGFTQNASLSQVKLIRRTSPTDLLPKATNVNFKALSTKGDLAQNARVQDQDIILVPKSKMSYIKIAIQNGALGLVYLGLQLSGN